MRTGLLALSLWLLAACDGEGTLVVQVRSDLTPVREFALARVRLEGEPREVVSAAVDHREWGRGVRVAEITGLTPGRQSLEVRLELPDGQVVASRAASAEIVSGVRVVTVLLTRACGGVVCPGDGDPADAVACHAGRCVPASCVEEEGPASCGGACETAASCAVPEGGCVVAECSPSGTCLSVPDHAACPSGQVCDPRVGGCVPSEAPCARWSPFDAPVALGPAIDTGSDEYGPSLSADGLTLYFTRQTDGQSRIWRARRADLASAFDAAAPVPSLADVEAGEPSVTADGRTLYFNLEPTNNRSTLQSAPVDEAGVVGTYDPVAFVTPVGRGASPDLTADGRLLTFVLGPYDESRVVLAERADPSGPFGAPVEVTSAALAGPSTGWPAISADGLELWFEADSDGTLDVFVARRATRDEPFGPPTPVDEVNVPAVLDGDADLAYDGSSLWITSRRNDAASGMDIFVAHRRCLD